jgi:hypothetical protein
MGGGGGGGEGGGGGGGGGGVATPPQYCNIAVLSGNYCNFNDTLVGKKYVIQQKITEILLKNCTNFGKLVKNGMSEKFSSPPPLANNFGKRNIN